MAEIGRGFAPTRREVVVRVVVQAERVTSFRYVGDERYGSGRVVRPGDYLVHWPGNALSALTEAEFRKLADAE